MIAADPFGPRLDAALLEAKAFLRIDGGDDDAAIAGMIASAASLCEGFTGQLTIARGVREAIVADGCWQRLGSTPVLSIDTVEASAIGETPVVLDPGRYAIDIDAAGDGWVRVARSTEWAIATVSCHAGLAADWSGLPDPLRQGVLRLVAHLYASRDRSGDAGPPAAVVALWRPYRRMRLA